MQLVFEGLGINSLVRKVDKNSTLREAINRISAIYHTLPWDRLWMECEGRVIDSSSLSIAAQNLQDNSLIRIAIKLSGGGGDGGSTGAESRDAFLKMYKLPKADKVDTKEENFAKWTCCQISGEPLNPPCVCDELGTLFNKEAVIKALIDKTMPESLSYITSLKHTIPLILARKPDTEPIVKNARNYMMSRDAEVKFHCPVTDLELNGSFRFSVHRKTGFVVSDKAIKEAPKAVEEIIGTSFDSEDWLPLNGSSAVVDELRQKMISNRRTAKSKKPKKRKSANTADQEKKKPKTISDFAPENATEKVYSSIFSKNESTKEETFLCRSVGARGMNLT